jgi:hypothetical protein
MALVAPDSVAVEVELAGAGGGWTDIGSDVLYPPGISLERGIRGAAPLDLVSSSSTATFSLGNTAACSGGVLGYYSPEHASKRSGWALGIACRIRVAYGTTRTVFRGWIDTIEPVLERHSEAVAVTVVDWMDLAARTRLSLATQTGKRVDQILTSIVAAVPRPPTGSDFDAGDSTFAYALDSSQSELGTVLSELQRLAQSEYGRIYVSADGTLVFRKRSSVLSLLPTVTLSDDMLSLRTRYERALVINTAKVTTHPRRVDATATTVLASLQTQPSIPAGQSITLTMLYTDPAQRAARVGGIDLVTPVATTDYTANTAADGSGTNLTANLTVTPTFGANSTDYVLANGSGSLMYVTKLQQRGRGLYDYDPVETRATDSGSITAYGENELRLDLPYQSDANTADAIGAYIVGAWKTPAAVEAEVEILGNKSAAFMAYALDGEVGQALQVIETATGIANAYRIQSVALFITGRGRIISARWGLQRGPIAHYWVLDSASYSQLGTTTILGPL